MTVGSAAPDPTSDTKAFIRHRAATGNTSSSHGMMHLRLNPDETSWIIGPL